MSSATRNAWNASFLADMTRTSRAMNLQDRDMGTVAEWFGDLSSIDPCRSRYCFVKWRFRRQPWNRVVDGSFFAVGESNGLALRLVPISAVGYRSEERRVGKERRSQGS